MRALGEPTGGRRLTDQQDTVDEPGRSPDERDGDADVDERTSPSPYAEKFDEWVADETAAPDGRQHRREAGSGDESTTS